MEMLRDSPEHHYYRATGPDDIPRGPFGAAQMEKALHKGLIDPKDRIWVSGLSSWFVARDLFRAFFESPEGQAVVERRRAHEAQCRRSEFRTAVEDFGVQFALSIVLGAVLVLADLPVILAPVLGTTGYWLYVSFRRDGVSVGMDRNGIIGFRGHRQKELGVTDGILRGMLSFFLIGLGGVEFFWAPRPRVTLSAHLLMVKPRFEEFFSQEGAEPRVPSPNESEIESSDAHVRENHADREPQPSTGLRHWSASQPESQPLSQVMRDDVTLRSRDPHVAPLPQRPRGRSLRKRTPPSPSGGTRPGIRRGA